MSLSPMRYRWKQRRPWSVATHWRGRPRITPEQIARACEMRANGEPLKCVAYELGIGLGHAHRITTRRLA